MTQPTDQIKASNTKLATFLKDSKIHPTRLLAVSHQLETLRPEDQAIKRAKKAAVGKDDEASKAARTTKPRSGRPVTAQLITAALAGKSISGPAKSRILRAVNAIQTAKKQPPADLRKLF